MGKTYPIFNNVNFNMVIFGKENKAKVDVQAEYSQDRKQW